MTRRAASGGAATVIATVPADTTSYADSELSASTEYVYQVFAFNVAGQALGSAQAFVSTEAEPTIPAAASNLLATAESDREIALSWTDNASDEDGFYVERRVAGASFARVATLGADVTSYDDMGLTASTEYFYRLAFNAVGDAPASNQGAELLEITLPARATGLVAQPLSDRSVALEIGRIILRRRWFPLIDVSLARHVRVATWVRTRLHTKTPDSLLPESISTHCIIQCSR